jgi:hypothetical protein
MSLNHIPKAIKMVIFMLCVFYHNKRKLSFIVLGDYFFLLLLEPWSHQVAQAGLELVGWLEFKILLPPSTQVLDSRCVPHTQLGGFLVVFISKVVLSLLHLYTLI